MYLYVKVWLMFMWCFPQVWGFYCPERKDKASLNNFLHTFNAALNYQWWVPAPFFVNWITDNDSWHLLLTYSLHICSLPSLNFNLLCLDLNLNLHTPGAAIACILYTECDLSNLISFLHMLQECLSTLDHVPRILHAGRKGKELYLEWRAIWSFK